MAGDWIKMRGNLWDDPRVAKLCDLTDQGEAAIIGALYWIWATADQHTEDGFMPGLTMRQIDRKTGVQGFGAALIEVGWMRDDPEGVFIIKFKEHNGSSAKRRASDAQRKANVRSMSAPDADMPKTEHGQKTPNLGARGREEEEEEEEKRKIPPPFTREGENGDQDPGMHAVSKAGAMCLLMRSEHVADVNPSSPELLALIEAGADAGMFQSAARSAVKRKKGVFAYVLATVRGVIADAQNTAQVAQATTRPAQSTESYQQRAARLRAAEFSSTVAARDPSANPNFIDVGARDVTVSEGR